MENHNVKLVDRTNRKESLRRWVDFNIQVIPHSLDIRHKQAELVVDGRNNDANLALTAKGRKCLEADKHKQIVFDPVE